MELYLVRHGEAKNESEDATRPLTDRGREEIQRVAQWAARIGLQPGEILHSGKRRAEETALILAEALSLKEKVRAISGLAPYDNIEPVAKFLRVEKKSIMLVGHLPFLSRLASWLLTGNQDLAILRFRKGAMICLERDESSTPAGLGPLWLLAWMVTPRIAETPE